MRDVRLEQANRRAWNEAAGPLWEDARRYLEFLDSNSHHVEAARRFDWDSVIRRDRPAEVLDLACGVGWLSGFLSARADVGHVIAWDGSPKLTGNLLPEAIRWMGGDIEKVSPVCGDFTPLLLDDDSVDLAVLASAFHHSDRPHELLHELRRVVRPKGFIVLLNEVPYSLPKMLRWIVTTAIAATVNATFPGRGLKKVGHLAADHAMYDPRLGDRTMTKAQWHRLLSSHGFRYRDVDSGLAPYRDHFEGQQGTQANLIHFVLPVSDVSSS